jgi:hypothetical protein
MNLIPTSQKRHIETVKLLEPLPAVRLATLSNVLVRRHWKENIEH